MSSLDVFAHLRIPLEDILSATNNFSDKNLIGEDASEKDYKGQLLWSGELINIFARRLNKEWFDGDQQFWMEVSMLSTLKHKNLVSLFGFCDESGEKITIIRRETRGSLISYLSDPMLLTWVRRLEISVGVAQALSYIHYDESRDFSVIHRNIKSSLIYLNDDWEPKLGDFICSMKIKASERHNSFNTDKVWSTDGYTDPVYIETKSAHHKSDIYSFGIVMFELLCGRNSVIASDYNKYLAQVAITHYREKKLNEIIDWGLWSQMDSQSFNMFAEIAYDCLKEERSQRPDIDEILPRLVKALELQQEHQNAADGLKANVQLKPPSAMEEIEKLSEEILKHSFNELPLALSVLASQLNKRWSLEEEIAKLTKDILKLSFNELAEEEEPMTFPCKEVYGDYQCENVMSIWPKLRETKRPMKPIAVGEKIKKFLRRRRDMVEGVPLVHDVGFVTFQLSDKWIDKSIHKMLRDGIDTWAPKLPVERVMIHIPSIAGEETIDERLRRACIRDTLTRMLEYSKVVVSSGGYDLEARQAQEDELNKCFLMEERDGDVVVYGTADGEPKPLIRGKGDEGFNNAFNDLGALWTGLVSGNADWIVFLTPVWRQEYVKMCFTAAEHARWISDKHYGVSYAAYRTRAELRTLFTLLERDEAVKSCGYTAASIYECAIKYAYLRNNRLAEITFNLNEMLRMKGNTFGYLLSTYAQIRKITSDSCKDIEKLKRASELTWEKVEGVEKDKQHALGLHLLGFTEVLKQSCLTVLPHILCEYLYKLSEKFNSYNSSYTSVLEDGSVAKTSRLLLCEASAVVMEKCFKLLGITLVYSGNIKSTKLWDEAQPSEYLSYLKKRLCVNEPKDLVITPDSLSVARDPSRSSRFELIAVRPQIANSFKEGKMCGYIVVSDVYGVRVDGWVPIDNPDCGYVSLLNYDWYDAINMENHGLVYPGNPSSGHTVPLSPSFYILMDLTVETKEKDSFFQLGYKSRRIDLSRFEGKNAADGECRSIIVKGKDMVLHMYYILLKDAVDTYLEVTFERDANAAQDADPVKVYGEIHAFYGNNFPYSSDPIIKRDYETSLFNPDANGLWAGPIRLRKSALAVPRSGSLVIRADLREVGLGNLIMDGSTIFTFEEATAGKDCSGIKVGSILGEGCSFHVKVNWNYKASPC